MSTVVQGALKPEFQRTYEFVSSNGAIPQGIPKGAHVGFKFTQHPTEPTCLLIKTIENPMTMSVKKGTDLLTIGIMLNAIYTRERVRLRLGCVNTLVERAHMGYVVGTLTLSAVNTYGVEGMKLSLHVDIHDQFLISGTDAIEARSMELPTDQIMAIEGVALKADYVTLPEEEWYISKPLYYVDELYTFPYQKRYGTTEEAT